MNIDMSIVVFALSAFIMLLSFLGAQLWNANKELSKESMQNRIDISRHEAELKLITSTANEINQIKIDLGKHDSDIKAIAGTANRIEDMIKEHEAKRAIFLDTFQNRVADTMRPYIENIMANIVTITSKLDTMQLHEREKK